MDILLEFYDNEVAKDVRLKQLFAEQNKSAINNGPTSAAAEGKV